MTDVDESAKPALHEQVLRSVRVKFQRALDQSTPFAGARWAGLVTLLLLYIIRVYRLEGFYIVTYGLGIFYLSLFISFLSPIDELEEAGAQGGGGILPTNDDDEFKPFQRRLGEFPFWYSCSKAIVIALAMTFFSIFDIPVFWPILLIYFLVRTVPLLRVFRVFRVCLYLNFLVRTATAACVSCVSCMFIFKLPGTHCHCCVWFVCFVCFVYVYI
jgi:hypothetical protein